MPSSVDSKATLEDANPQREKETALHALRQSSSGSYTGTEEEEQAENQDDRNAETSCPHHQQQASQRVRKCRRTKKNLPIKGSSERPATKVGGQLGVSANEMKPESMNDGAFHIWLGNTMAERLINQPGTVESTDLVPRLYHIQMAASAPTSTTGSPKKATKWDVFNHANVNKAATSEIRTFECVASTDSVHTLQPEAGSDMSPSLRAGTAGPKKKKADGNTFTLDDFAALTALNSLFERWGRASHMGILDPSYSFFMSKQRNAALYYKVKNKTAIVGGDPLCPADLYPALLEEFRRFRKQHGWGIAFLGATDNFIGYAKQQKKWVTMRFGTERVLNVSTNSVLHGTEGKRMIKQNKQLLDPRRGGIRIDTYVPAQGRDLVLEHKLADVYNSWREHRNQTGRSQAYMTVFDPFALPNLMVYIYTTDGRDPDSRPNGFAALRKIGPDGYHIDPYCATPDAPRGITDLLIFSAMALLHHAGMTYLSLGFEPAKDLTEICSLSRPIARIIGSCYRRAFQHLPVSGKKAYHDKFHPDEKLGTDLYLVYPEGVPTLRNALALMHVTNIRTTQLIKAEVSARAIGFVDGLQKGIRHKTSAQQPLVPEEGKKGEAREVSPP